MTETLNCTIFAAGYRLTVYETTILKPPDKVNVPNDENESIMKILVAIASYGTNNDQYLQQLIDEYSSMPYLVDIVVVSNIPKALGKEVEVVVGLPSKNPWSLPFAHKRIFIARQNHYDLFIYSEDDTLITQQNIEAFLQVTALLNSNEIAGFLRSE